MFSASWDSVRKWGSLPPSIMWIKLRTAVGGHIFGRFYIDLNHDIEQSVIIAGTHRSGSTWLAGLINDGLHYRLLFEPVRHAREEPFRSHRRRYLRPGASHEPMRQSFEKVLKGTERSYHQNRKNVNLLCKGRLLKDVSLNLLLKWLRVEFPQVPIIFIIRNPYLVVSSCLKVDWLSPKKPDYWLRQEELVADFLQPYLPLIRSAQTAVEQYMLEWCILNMVPLRQFQPDEWHLVSYDALLLNPEAGLRQIFDYLQIPFQAAVLDKLALPSHTAEEKVGDRQQLLAKWKNVLTADDEQTIQTYARAFGLEAYLGH